MKQHMNSVSAEISRIPEDQYPRCDYHGGHLSLCAIHAGQVKSLLLQQPETIPGETTILRISVEKGGSSVLADGWLVAGTLERREADFFFGFGVMLQLLDDLQDLADDRRMGHCTLFSRATAHGQLDCVTSCLWHFLDAVLDSAAYFHTSRGPELKELIRRNSRMLLLRAMAENARFYSRDYLDRMGNFSTLRFDYLRAVRKTIENKFRKIWPPLARPRNLRSIFDLLG